MSNSLKNYALRSLARITRRCHPRGTNRLLTRIYNPDHRRIDYLQTIIGYDSRLRINIDTRDFLEWLVFFYGHHEPEVVREIQRLFRPGFVAFDIGANSGCHTLVMADQAGEGGRIFSAEPNPLARQRLKENIELNHLSNVTVLPRAFSNRPGLQNLFVPVPGTANRGVASLYSENVNYEKEAVKVEIRTLDGEVAERGLDRLDFIKVDTEGNELKVLQGGRESLKRFQPYLVFEYDHRAWNNSGADFEEAAEFLSELGYSLSLLGSRSRISPPDPLPPTANFLAVPRSR